MFDLVVRGGTVVTASDVTACDIGIRDGRIVMLGEGLAPGREELDATGLYVLPGGIDSHVHLAQPSGDGIVMADGFESGTRSALFGGNTTILPFCLQQKGQTLREALTAYHALAEGNCLTDVSFHLIVTDPTPGEGGHGGRGADRSCLFARLHLRNFATRHFEPGRASALSELCYLRGTRRRCHLAHPAS